MKNLTIILITLILCNGSFSFAAQAKPLKSAKRSYLGVTLGRGSPVENKSVSFGGAFYESHFDDYDYSLSFDQSFGTDIRLQNYTMAFGKNIENEEGPNLRLFVGAGLSSVLSNQTSYDGVQSIVGFDVCPPVKLVQVCGRFNVRFTDSELMQRSSQEFSLVIKRMSF